MFHFGLPEFRRAGGAIAIKKQRDRAGGAIAERSRRATGDSSGNGIKKGLRSAIATMQRPSTNFRVERQINLKSVSEPIAR